MKKEIRSNHNKIIIASFIARAFLEGYKKGLDFNKKEMTIGRVIGLLYGGEMPKSETLDEFLEKHS
jgi:hypothetical protein